MRVERLSWLLPDCGELAKLKHAEPDLIIYFGSRASLASGAAFEQLKATCPGAMILGCTTGGQIHEHDAVDDEITGVAIRFDETKIRLVSEMVGSSADSRTCGRAIGERLLAPDIAGIFILSDGLNVNGSELVAGITEMIGPHVPLTGGLAGDGSRFEETLVGANCAPQSRMVAGIGFYGNAIRIGHGSAGGWDVFGPWRKVTRSQGNVLFELDGEPALDLYERYLGDEAEGLPGTGLLFPLQIQNPDNADHRIVRTILAVDRDKRSLTFAGDIPVGWSAQLMRGNFDRLSRGAADAARQATEGFADGQATNGVALLVSCIGRRLLMGQRVSEEIEAAGAVLGTQFARLGFYSYGEISPHAVSGICELHNQTMTITTITEFAA
jgi:hypothetical protein